MTKTHTINSQKGFTLLELLLAIGVITALFTGATVVFNDWAKDSVDRKVSREMQQLQDAAREYVRLNLDDIITNDIPNVGDTDEINITTDLVDNGFLPDGYTAINSYRQPLSVYIRNADDDSINGDVIEVLSFSEGIRVDDRRLFNAASNGQKSVGVISNLDISATCCDGNIQSISGGWSVPITNYTAPTTISVPNADGGYMAAYDVVSVNNEISTDYLHRTIVNGMPELNRMETNLNLNNNDITNAAIIVADGLEIQGNATLNGRLRDGTQSPYVLSVRNNLNIGQNINVLSDGINTKGSAIINGDDAFGDDFIVNDTLSMQNPDLGLGNINAPTVSTDNIQINGLSEFDDLDVNGANVDATDIINNTTQYDDQITVNTLQASNASLIGEIRTNTAVIADVNVSNPNGFILSNNQSMDVASTTSISNNTNTQNILGTTEVTIQNMISCTSGCP